jgi:hypothetical protein
MYNQTGLGLRADVRHTRYYICNIGVTVNNDLTDYRDKLQVITGLIWNNVAARPGGFRCDNKHIIIHNRWNMECVIVTLTVRYIKEYKPHVALWLFLPRLKHYCLALDVALEFSYCVFNCVTTV